MADKLRLVQKMFVDGVMNLKNIPSNFYVKDTSLSHAMGPFLWTQNMAIEL